VRLIGETLVTQLSVVLAEGTFQYTLTVDKVSGRILLSGATE